MWNFSGLQPFNPRIADELAVARKGSDALAHKRVLEGLHQLDPLSGIRVARLVKDTPEQRHAHIAVRHAENQNVDIGLAKLPVRAIQRQMLIAALRRERQAMACLQGQVPAR